MPGLPELRIGLVGFGTVGTGVARILAEQADHIAATAGRRLSIARIVVRDAGRHRAHVPAGTPVSENFGDILNDDSIGLVVQLIGGTSPAREFIERSLAAGKDVVTANKALIYAHGEQLFGQASELGRTICFEAAVAGGIPIISCLNTALTGNRIESIEGILNGTSNFILTHMLKNGQSYDDVLKEAQRRGYAEADPALDVDGTDAAQKLAILSQLAFSTRVTIDDIVQRGIDELELEDLRAAAELGYKVKLLAMARRHNGLLEVSVQPTLVSVERTLAQTDGADNIVEIDGDAVGRLRLAGAGAGQLPTASAVVADIVDYATGRAAITFSSLMRSRSKEPVNLMTADDLRRRCYLRCIVDDRPHVLADVADVLGRNEISISSLHQEEPQDSPTEPGVARLVIMTHEATEGAFRSAERELSTLNCMRGPSLRMPVAPLAS